MFVYFSYFLFVLACILNIYLIVFFIKSKGELPPFIASVGAPKKAVIEQASAFLKQNPTAKIADLGCGSGSLLIPLAKQFPNHQFVGYEWDFVPYFLGKLKAHKLKNITYLRRDFFKEDLSGFQLILCYLGTGEIQKQIGTKLNNELSSDSLIISEIFQLENLKKHAETDIKCGPMTFKIYQYKSFK